MSSFLTCSVYKTWSNNFVAYFNVEVFFTTTENVTNISGNAELTVTFSGLFSDTITKSVTFRENRTNQLYADHVSDTGGISLTPKSQSLIVTASLDTKGYGTFTDTKTVHYNSGTVTQIGNLLVNNDDFDDVYTSKTVNFTLDAQQTFQITGSSDCKTTVIMTATDKAASETIVLDKVGNGTWLWTPTSGIFGPFYDAASTVRNFTIDRIIYASDGVTPIRTCRLGSAALGPGNGPIYPSMREVIFSGKLPESVRPIISTVTPSDTKGYRAKFGVYVQGKSILAATTVASGIYNSTITKVDYVIDNKTGSTPDLSLVKTIGLLEQSGSRTLTTTVTDSRDRTAVRNTAITVAAYVNPSLTFQAMRWNTETAQESDGSTTVRLVCSGEVPSINDVLVTGTLTVQGRQKGVAAWTTIGTASVSGTFEEIFTKTNQSLDYSYEYQATLIDEFGVTITQSSEVGTSTPVLEFHASGKGMGIGTVAPENGLAIELPITGSGLYPVGSVIIRYDHISPASLYGGVWERIEGRFLYATGASGTIGATGGSGTHTLTVDEMPAHRHGWSGVNSGTTVTTQMGTYPFDIEQDKKSNWTGTSSMIANTGGGKAHNNNPAFVNVSVWRRVE